MIFRVVSTGLFIIYMMAIGANAGMIACSIALIGTLIQAVCPDRYLAKTLKLRIGFDHFFQVGVVLDILEDFLRLRLLLGLLLLADIFAFTEVAALLRKPSDTAVLLGLLLLALLAVVNFFIIRYSLSKLDA